MATETKVVTHTPGPWHNEKPLPESRTASAVICGAPPSCVPHIAYIPQNGYAATLDEQAANARLIAAAPDLYEALTVLIALYAGVRDMLGPSVRKKLAQAEAAIAKVEGR